MFQWWNLSTFFWSKDHVSINYLYIKTLYYFYYKAGTGKTHTIKGIISMLNAVLRKDKKILVCAPSNAAIDEIITRLISKGGLLG